MGFPIIHAWENLIWWSVPLIVHFSFSLGLVEGSDIRRRRDGSHVTKKLGFASRIIHTVSTTLVSCIGQMGNVLINAFPSPRSLRYRFKFNLRYNIIGAPKNFF
jgi:hypothetical protein